MKMRAAITTTLLSLFASMSLAEDISSDTKWSGEKTISDTVRITAGTLTIEPGTKLTFTEAGAIAVSNNAAIIAKGTKDNPIKWIGKRSGRVTGTGHLLLEFCHLTGMGPDDPKTNQWLNFVTGQAGVSIRDCQFTDCGGIEMRGQTLFELLRCDFRETRGGVRNIGRRISLIENTFLHVGDKQLSISGGSVEEAEVRGNVMINCTLSGFTVAGGKETPVIGKSVIEHNYIHIPFTKGSYCVMYSTAAIRNNIFRGASWTTARIGGHIEGNVFEAIPTAEAERLGNRNEHGTHEQLCGLMPNSTVHRNIFLHGSYGAIMGIALGTCEDAVITSNTFDMRGVGNPIFLNHQPKNNAKNVVIRNNLFMRGDPIFDERGIADSIVYCDYNLWAGEPKKGRFDKVRITNKQPGDAGFGANDLPKLAGGAAVAIKPEAVVANPDFELPYTQEELLSRKYTVAQALQLYRDAYTPKEGSAVINAGDPSTPADPLVTDGKVDIGAIEHK